MLSNLFLRDFLKALRFYPKVENFFSFDLDEVKFLPEGNRVILVRASEWPMRTLYFRSCFQRQITIAAILSHQNMLVIVMANLHTQQRCLSCNWTTWQISIFFLGMKNCSKSLMRKGDIWKAPIIPFQFMHIAIYE